MKKTKSAAIVIILFNILNFTFCGGGSDSSGKTPTDNGDNPSADTVPPQFVSAIVKDSSPDNIEIKFDEPVIITSPDGFSVTADTSATVNDISGSGSATIILNLNREITYGETVTIDYNSASGNAADTAGNPLESFSSMPVTNSVGYLFSPEGSVDSPLDLGTIPVDYGSGEVGDATSGASYYSADVNLNYKYKIDLTGLSDDANLYVFSDDTFTTLYTNGSSENTGSADESVTITATGTAIYILVDPANIESDGTSYTLAVTLYYVHEGESGSPLHLGTAPPAISETGCVDNTDQHSYYYVNLDPIFMYQVQLTGLTDDTDLEAYTDSSFTTPAVLHTDNTGQSGTADESLIIFNGNSVLYIKADSTNISGDGAYYTISVTVFYESEGTTVAPVSIGTASLVSAATHTGCVGNTTDSYYTANITNLNYRCSIQLTDLTDNSDLYVYSDSTYTTLYDNGSSENIGTTGETVEVDSEATTLYIKISYNGTGNGAYYTLSAQEIYYHTGSINYPEELAPLPSDYLSCVDNSSDSYYSVDITGGVDIYTVSISSLSDEANLEVYYDKFINHLGVYPGSSEISIDVAGVLSDYLYIRVIYGGAGNGTYYRLNVSEYSGVPAKTIYYISTFDNATSSHTPADTYIFLSDATSMMNGIFITLNNNGGNGGGYFSEIVYPMESGITYYLIVTGSIGRYSAICGTSPWGSASSGTALDSDGEDADDAYDTTTTILQTNHTFIDRTLDMNNFQDMDYFIIQP